jgi:sarcosine oxidase subunit alpha
MADSLQDLPNPGVPPGAPQAIPAGFGLREREQPFRLAAGGRIGREQRLAFRFDNKTYHGYAGDTLASALLANGVRLLGRSFKYHRPRGILTAGSEEPNALVELRSGDRREPNSKATVAELYDGLEAVSQNRFPSLKFDLLSCNDLLSPALSAGFYYKTFMWPTGFWEKLYEPLIRRAAGLGRLSAEADPDAYEKSHAFCDVLVIGGGLSGIEAAIEAAKSGARVLLCEEDFALGGRALASPADSEAASRLSALLAQLPAFPELTLLARTTVFGRYDGNTFAAVQRLADHLVRPPPGMPRQRYWKIVARRSVLASGALERPLLFGNNDLPGVMLSGAVARYVHRFGVVPGSRAVLFINNAEAMAALTALRAAAIEVAALVDAAGLPEAAIRQAEHCGARVFSGVVLRAYGRSRVQGVEILSDRGRARVECDLLVVSGGFDPAIQLAVQAGARSVFDEACSAFKVASPPPGMGLVGRAEGGLGPAPFCLPRAGSGKVFVDFQNDVTADDVALARREGFSSVEHLKRYTTLGMATDQGKTANVNALSLMATLQGAGIARGGSTAPRPPYTPVAIGALAGRHRGRHYKPERLTPTHAFAHARGAVFVGAGLWLRAQYFPQAAEADWLATVSREVRTVREHVGICDVTPLGKIDIQGPDAARLLDCVYTNSWSNLAIGRARYGLMLREDGFVMDDGTCARIGPQHFIMTTTTANAAKVMQHLEFCHQWLWPTLQVRFCSVTDQWAQIAVAGPKSRLVLRVVVDAAFDLSNEGLPYMGVQRVTVCGGTPAWLFRLSFSGELGYEIAVPARYGEALAARLMEAGARHGIAAYGTEALGVMRIEKGHPAGAELNGQTTAHDLGFAKLLSGRKDFIGRAMALRPALTDPNRPRLVGLKPVAADTRLRAGSHLLPREAPARAEHDQGHITSVAFSPTLGHWIGLGLLRNGPARHGEILRVYDPVRNGDTFAEVVHPVFIDPAGERLRG